MEEFEKFRREVLKLDKPRKSKIKNSTGLRDAYQWLRKNKMFGVDKMVTEGEFYKIISTTHKEVAKELCSGEEFVFPLRMGKLELRHVDTYVKFEEGKVKTNRSVDWNRTLQLWNEDDEARENKVLIRKENKKKMFVFYNTIKSNYKNKTFIFFRPNRELLLAVAKAYEENNFSTYKI
jgi:hypothetical protein